MLQCAYSRTFQCSCWLVRIGWIHFVDEMDHFPWFLGGKHLESQPEGTGLIIKMIMKIHTNGILNSIEKYLYKLYLSKFETNI